MRILHVEDDQDTRTLVAFILEAQGWNVVSVDKGSAAIKLAGAGVTSGIGRRVLPRCGAQKAPAAACFAFPCA